MIFQKPSVEIDANFVPECFLYEGVLIFCDLAFQDGRHLPLLKIAQNVKMTT